MSAPSARQRRLRYRADARRAILDAAEALLVESGADGFSMRRLAERCGYTAPTIYHYFRDKPHLIEELLEERMRRLAAELRAARGAEDPVEEVAALGAAFARFGLRNPSHYQLLVTTRGDDAPDPPSAEVVRALFGEPLDALVGSAGLRETQLETLRQGLWCLLHGFILLQTTRPDDEWEPELLGASLGAMIRGFLTGGGAPVAKGRR